MTFFSEKELHLRPEDGCPPAARACGLALRDNVLDPWRERVGELDTHCCYRNPKHNAEVLGMKASQHLDAEAWDGLPKQVSKKEAWDALEGLPYDQRIWEEGCIHVSYSSHHPQRGQSLRYVGTWDGERHYGPF